MTPFDSCLAALKQPGPPEALFKAVDKALALAERICANAPLAVWATRRVVLGSQGEGDDVGWRLTDEAFAEIIRSEDFAEGVQAFLQKRPAVFKGR